MQSMSGQPACFNAALRHKQISTDKRASDLEFRGQAISTCDVLDADLLPPTDVYRFLSEHSVVMPRLISYGFLSVSGWLSWEALWVSYVALNFLFLLT